MTMPQTSAQEDEILDVAQRTIFLAKTLPSVPMNVKTPACSYLSGTARILGSISASRNKGGPGRMRVGVEYSRGAPRVAIVQRYVLLDRDPDREVFLTKLLELLRRTAVERLSIAAIDEVLDEPPEDQGSTIPPGALFPFDAAELSIVAMRAAHDYQLWIADNPGANPAQDPLADALWNLRSAADRAADILRKSQTSRVKAR